MYVPACPFHSVKHLKCDLLYSSAAYLHYLINISMGSNSEGAATGIVLSGLKPLVKILLNISTDDKSRCILL